MEFCALRGHLAVKGVDKLIPKLREMEIDIEMKEIQISGEMWISEEMATDISFEPQIQDGDLASSLVRAKHREYTTGARRFRCLYWATRLVAGLASGLLLFVISTSASIATGLLVAIVISVVIDSVFDPKSRYQLYSRASDLLRIAQSKAAGDWQRYKEQIDIIVATERQLERLVDLEGHLFRYLRYAAEFRRRMFRQLRPAAYSGLPASLHRTTGATMTTSGRESSPPCEVGGTAVAGGVSLTS